MSLIERRVKTRLLKPDEVKTEFASAPPGGFLLRGGIILESEIWLTAAEAATPEKVVAAENQIRAEINRMAREGSQ